ncbi:MAG TPA: hypothetical protein VFK73_07725 [Paludibacter sp.]|nr:hypothetical protein [Paludibacter sp.]
MKTTNESGHNQNVINFELLGTIIATFGPTYNPPKSTLAIPGLTELAEKGKLEINAVNTAEVVCNNAIAARSNAFDDFDNTITRIINALRISGVSAQTLAQAEAIVRDLRGKRASALLTEEQLAAEKEKGNDIKQVVVHNATIDSKIENLSKLILFLETIPQYKPNESDLKLESLKEKLTDIKTKNTGLVAADATLNAARRSRNEVLYADNEGLVDTALDVKLYTKSLFGATSPQYKQISSIAFTKPR